MISRTSSVPLYVQLHRHLKGRIRSSDFKQGQRIPSETELSAQYGVSLITIRQAVRALADEGLVERKQGKGTFVIENPGEKRGSGNVGPGKNIGISFLNFNHRSEMHPFLSRIVQGVAGVCNARGYFTQLLATPEAGIQDAAYSFLRETIAAGRVAGVISASDMNHQDIVFLQDNKVPFVSIANDLADDDIPCVLGNGYAGTSRVVDCLAARGHRRIGLVTGPKGGMKGTGVLFGYKAALERHGLPVREEWVRKGDFTEEGGYEIMKELLAPAGEHVTALYIADDYMAAGAARAALDHGFTVPGEIDIIGSGNFLPLASSPLVGSVNVCPEESGRIAAEMLIALIEGEEIENRCVVLEPELVMNNGFQK